jgi:hypothetical protein
MIRVRLVRSINGVTIHPPREYSGDRGTVPVRWPDKPVEEMDRASVLIMDRVLRACGVSL